MPAVVEFEILGSLAVHGDSGEIPVAGARRRALLVRLLTVANELVPAPLLAEDLWEGEPPPGALSTLQSHISILRKLLGTDRITGRDRGYILEVADNELDVRRFEDESKRGRDALAGGDPESASRLLGSALGRWRGAALADVSGSAWALPEQTRLEELRLSATETWIESRLELGENSEVVALSEAAITEHPLREGLWGHLMLALYRSGRQAEALRAYRRLRTLLGEELGIEPSAQLAALDDAIVQQKTDLNPTGTQAVIGAAWKWRNPLAIGHTPIDSDEGQPPGGTFIGDGSLPVRLAVRPSVGVVGRENELASIAEAYKRVADGQGREVLLVSGEAGLGKSTLVAEAARTAFRDGACVLLGHCDEDLATPYQLFVEALTHYALHAPDQELSACLDTHGPELTRLIPALGRRIPGLPVSRATDADTERYLLFAAVVGLLSAVSLYRPVVLILDDLQWADQGSLLLLRHLSAADRQMRVLVIGTFRDTEVSRSDPLLETLGALRRHGGIERVELKGLDDSGVVAFVEAAAGYTLDAAGVDLAHSLYRETDGNPFFVSEVLRHLVETGAIYQDPAGRWVPGEAFERVGLPNSVHEVIGARVVRLGAAAARILSLASVIGRDFDLEVMTRAAETSEDELLELLDAAEVAALVRETPGLPGRYSFAHALIQRTLYEDLGPTRMARAHRRVAEAIEDLCGARTEARVGELARHWFAATRPSDAAKALSYSRQAADAALGDLAPADALRYYAQALDLYALADDLDPVLGIDLAIGLGTAQRQTGNAAFRETLLSAAHRAADLGDTDRLVAAALANDRGYFSSGGAIDAEKVEILEMALDRLSADNPNRPLVLATLCSELTFGSPLERRQALADEAVAIAESSGDDATIVRVLNHVLPPLGVPSLHEQSLIRTAAALVRAERVADPVLLFFAAAWRAAIAARSGDTDEMDRCIEIYRSLAEQLDQPTLNWLQRYMRAFRAQIAGDTDRTEELATEALRIGTSGGHPDAALYFGAQLIPVNLQRGTLGDLVPIIEQMAAVAPASAGVIIATLAVAHVEGGRAEDAALLLEKFAADDFALPMDAVWLTGMVCYAEAAIQCRDLTCARPLFDRLIPWAHQMSTSGGTAEGPVSYYLGGLATVLGRYDEADGYFAHAAAFSKRAGAKFFAAQTDLLWGKMLAERQALGDIDEARVLLVKAHSVAAGHGYGKLEHRAAEALEHLDH